MTNIEGELPFKFDPGKVDLGHHDEVDAVLISDEMITGLRAGNIAEVTRTITTPDGDELSKFTLLRRLVPEDPSVN